MDIKAKYIRLFASAVAVGLLCLLLGATSLSVKAKRAEKVCTGLDVVFADSLKFITAEDIQGFLDKQYGSYVGQKLDSVGLARIERLLEAKSAVMESEAWTTDDGMLHVSITQRAPAIRFQKGMMGFYADDTGFIFPTHKTFTAPVPCIKGDIPVTITPGFKGELESEREKQWVLDVLALTRFMSKSKTLDGKIAEMSVNSDGDIVMTPTTGSETIIFGSPTDAGEKFTRLEKYYSHILPAKGEGYYKIVNVKYNGQIICRKDI